MSQCALAVILRQSRLHDFSCWKHRKNGQIRGGTTIQEKMNTPYMQQEGLHVRGVIFIMSEQDQPLTGSPFHPEQTEATVGRIPGFSIIRGSFGNRAVYIPKIIPILCALPKEYVTLDKAAVLID